MEGTIHGLLDNNITDTDLNALARVRDGEAAITVLLMVDMGEDKAGFVPWQSQDEIISMDHMPSSEECRKILLQKVQLPRLLSVYRLEECIDELERQNMGILEEWQHAKMLSGELVLMLNRELSTELCGFKLRYDEEYGLICGKEE